MVKHDQFGMVMQRIRGTCTAASSSSPAMHGHGVNGQRMEWELMVDAWNRVHGQCMRRIAILYTCRAASSSFSSPCSCRKSSLFTRSTCKQPPRPLYTRRTLHGFFTPSTCKEAAGDAGEQRLLPFGKPIDIPDLRVEGCGFRVEG